MVNQAPIYDMRWTKPDKIMLVDPTSKQRHTKAYVVHKVRTRYLTEMEGRA